MYVEGRSDSRKASYLYSLDLMPPSRCRGCCRTVKAAVEVFEAAASAACSASAAWSAPLILSTYITGIGTPSGVINPALPALAGGAGGAPSTGTAPICSSGVLI
jgi:hypothetical protein